jgi:hypothetical protein
MGSYAASVDCAAQVAAEAMALWQALEGKREQPYAAMFKDVRPPEVMRALARAHAASGKASEALAWAKQIGSGDKANPSGDYSANWPMQQRISALVGVAEGILDRSGSMVQK